MNLQQVNEVLSNLEDLGRKYSKVCDIEPEDLYNMKDQGDESYRTEVYRLGIEDHHLKVVSSYNSYGDYSGITSIQFVKPIVKQVTDFE